MLTASTAMFGASMTTPQPEMRSPVSSAFQYGWGGELNPFRGSFWLFARLILWVYYAWDGAFLSKCVYRFLRLFIG